MTPPLHTRASYVAALLLGCAIGGLYGSWRSAADLAALDRDLAVLRARCDQCEEALTSDYTEATRTTAGQCEVAATACAQVAESAVATERVARGLLWVAPGPEVRR